MAEGPKLIRVFIADDHPVVRYGLSQLIDEEEGMECVGEASTSSEALHGALETEVDVVLLDLEMPGRGGLDTLRVLKSREPDLKVLVLSHFPEDPYALRAIKGGASGYLNKDSVVRELTHAIRTVAGGSRYLTPETAEQLAIYAQEPGPVDEAHKGLSDREFQVFCLIGKGMTVSEIADELSLSVKTISTYRSRILDKMRLNNNAQLIRYAVEKGIV